ncbi:MAG TPA: hypothetical protein VK689_17665, partial [Armatimonadota bacterium]|nr:hypothetical protein [Armatimonadota bacterium]
RTVSGKVIRVVRRANPPLMIVMTNGARQTFDIGSAVISHRATSGDQLVEATIQDIVAGDDVIIRLDRTGQVARRIEVTHGTGR